MIVIGASVALKWVIPEENSNEAHALLAESLGAPELWLIEAANALWKHAATNKITQAHARSSLEKLKLAPVASLSLGDEIVRALEISLRLKHPIYDCIYLALAMAHDTYVITADSRFLSMASRDASLRNYVRGLSSKM